MSIPVSIIVPNYNHAYYLTKRFDCIISQTHSNVEVIILDDKSSDNSLEVIDAYAKSDPRIKVVANEVNSGSTFKQWKKGLALCSAEYVWIAESDDYAEPTFLEKLLPLLVNNAKVGLAYSNSWKVDGLGQKSVPWSDWKNATFATTRWDADYLNAGPDEVANYLMFDCTINNTSAVLFRKSVLENVIEQIQQFRYAGDWYAFIAICLRHDIAYTAEKLNYFRQHTENVSLEAVRSGKILYERFKCMSLAMRELTGYPAQKKKLVRQLAQEVKAFVVSKRQQPADNSLTIKALARALFAYDKQLAVAVLWQIGLGKLLPA